jgi:excisionase family DNA binding protein
MTMTAVVVEPLWTIDDLANFLRVPVKTIYEWRRHKRGPQAVRIGKYLRFDPEHVRAWINTRTDI